MNEIGRYKIECELGRGGMAVVYKAYDPQLERSVAIKLIRMNSFSVDMFIQVRERFEREAKALAKLNHPNIIHVFDYGLHEGAPYLVMDYIEGATLKEVKKPVRVDTAVKLLLPIVDALTYIHNFGLLHRDVKPSNIMITRNDQRVILTDFGIVKWMSADDDFFTLTATNGGIGTPEYMSPEQGRGKKVDERSDMYSLSIVFYELITGKKPFTGDSPIDILLKQINDPIPDPQNFVPDLPPSLTKFFHRAMAKAPEDRYPSMKEFLLDLSGLKLQAQTQTHLATEETKAKLLFQKVPDSKTGSSIKIERADVHRIREASSPDSQPLTKRKWSHYSIPLALTIGLIAVSIFFFPWIKDNFILGRDLFTNSIVVTETPLQKILNADAQPIENSAINETISASTIEARAFALEQTQFAIDVLEKERLFIQAQSKTQEAQSTVWASTQVDAMERLNQTAQAIENKSITGTVSASQLQYAQTESALQLSQAKTESALQFSQAQTESASQFSQAQTESASQVFQAQTETAYSFYISTQVELRMQEATAKADAQAKQATLESELAASIYATQEAENAQKIKVGDIITLGRYEQDNDRTNGLEEISWIVLRIEGGSALVISADGLDAKPYHSVAGQISWEFCSYRRWLNNDFYHSAFNEREKGAIEISTVVNGYDSKNNVNGGNDTQDKLFLLSASEVEQYMTEKEIRMVKPTKFAISRGAWRNANNGNGWWRLRNPGIHRNQTMHVNSVGEVITTGTVVTSGNGAVRPAMTINLASGLF